MRYTEIAIAKPFEGAPKINMADIFGASPEKPIILRIPVVGKRPITYGASGLPDGLTLNDGIITGTVHTPGNYGVTLIAENELGRDEKNVTFEIGEGGVLLTPLLGFTSWNAFASDVTAEKIESTARLMVEKGLTEYGYSYVNTDSGWQDEYGGRFDAIMADKEKFPDMKKMCDTLHALGLKAGIYSTPMLTAWGCPPGHKPYPGCTTGEPDELQPLINTGIGVVRKEANNVAQWTEWGFDYLKYDWAPTEPYNAELMRRELKRSDRDFGYCVTTSAHPRYTHYFSKYVNSYRNNIDSVGTWSNFLEIFNSYGAFVTAMKKGHFFDLDMLDTGHCLEGMGGTKHSEDEQICVYTLRAFMGSPIQISSQLSQMDEFELSLYCNEEIIAINQDTAFHSAKPYMIIEDGKKMLRIYRRLLSEGGTAYAAFNLGETEANVNIYLDGECSVRDVWAKKDIGVTDTVALCMPPHTVKVFKAVCVKP